MVVQYNRRRSVRGIVFRRSVANGLTERNTPPVPAFKWEFSAANPPSNGGAVNAECRLRMAGTTISCRGKVYYLPFRSRTIAWIGYLRSQNVILKRIKFCLNNPLDGGRVSLAICLFCWRLFVGCIPRLLNAVSKKKRSEWSVRRLFVDEANFGSGTNFMNRTTYYWLSETIWR